MSTLQVDAAVVVPEETAAIAPHRRTSSTFVKEAPTAIQFVGPFVVSHHFDVLAVCVSVFWAKALIRERRSPSSPTRIFSCAPDSTLLCGYVRRRPDLCFINAHADAHVCTMLWSSTSVMPREKWKKMASRWIFGSHYRRS